MQGRSETEQEERVYEFPETTTVRVLSLIPYMKWEVYQQLCKARKARDNSKPIVVDFRPFPHDLTTTIFKPILETCIPTEKKQQTVDYLTNRKVSSVCSLYSLLPHDLDYLFGTNWWKLIDVIPGSRIKDGTFEVVGNVSLVINPHNEGRVTLKCNARLFNNKGIQQ